MPTIGDLLLELIEAREGVSAAEGMLARARARYQAAEREVRRARGIPGGPIRYRGYIFTISRDCDIPVTLDRVTEIDPDRDANRPPEED
jgi:hypothetical protein